MFSWKLNFEQRVALIASVSSGRPKNILIIFSFKICFKNFVFVKINFTDFSHFEVLSQSTHSKIIPHRFQSINRYSFFLHHSNPLLIEVCVYARGSFTDLRSSDLPRSVQCVYGIVLLQSKALISIFLWLIVKSDSSANNKSVWEISIHIHSSSGTIRCLKGSYNCVLKKYFALFPFLF